jgi:serine/threonine-protein kinase
LVFVAQAKGDDQRLYIRRLDQTAASPLKGTEGAVAPFFSPDGQWIGFIAGGKLKKIAVAGGSSVPLAEAPVARGATWETTGTIVFNPNNDAGGALFRVSDAAGVPERLTTVKKGDITHRWPQVLPGGRAVLYTVSQTFASYTNARLEVQPLTGGEPRVVQRNAYYGRYVPSGHLLWLHDGTLFAARFDLKTFSTTGSPVPVVQGVESSDISGFGSVAVSDNGTLAYVAGNSSGNDAPLNWVPRDAKITPIRERPLAWNGIQVSPDGKRLAFGVAGASGSGDIYTYEPERDALIRVTSDPLTERNPAWTPDGQRLVYSVQKESSYQLYWQRADGSGTASRLTETTNQHLYPTWHPSGRILLYDEVVPGGSSLMTVSVEGSESTGWKVGAPTPFLTAKGFSIAPARFSPDGHWLAYQSNELGRYEIWVRPFPGPGGRWRVSPNGGTNAVWSRARPELLYRGDDGRIMVVPYKTSAGSFDADKPQVWSDVRVQLRPLTGIFDLHPDGKRVVAAPFSDIDTAHVMLVFNFFDELRRLAP